MVIKVEEFQPAYMEKFGIQKRHRGNQGSRSNKSRYLDVICAFDIETTRIPEIEQSFMYIWQFAIGPDMVVYGRTWKEYMEFLSSVLAAIPADASIVVWVHNLSYEFQFLRGVYPFEKDDVFAIDSRKILKCTMFSGRVEYRCSFIHSNMSLAEYTHRWQVPHEKLKDFEYDGIRYPWTELAEDELAYCVNDVLGLVEALAAEMISDGDNLYSVPLTSTGYVRRDVKRALRGVSATYLRPMLPDYNQYLLLRQAFRGGNTHANRFYADRKLINVHSADRSSSYPDVICNCKFPMRKWYHLGECSSEKVHELMQRGKALLMRVRMYDVDLRSPDWGCPYLARNKCRDYPTLPDSGSVFDNGRIIKAAQLETTITDIDLRIIEEEYNAAYEFVDVYYTGYGTLPRQIVDQNIIYYNAKTSLKGVPDQETYYMKSKNRLNSIYGMMATSPLRVPWVYYPDGSIDGELFMMDTEANERELLEIANRKAFLSYSWGVWVTAWARYYLELGIRAAHEQGAFVYCDTDSVKYLGNVDWSGYNADRITASTESGATAVDAKGIRHYMGVMEQERDYTEFKTLGAKKYVGRHDDGKLEVTIAGVGKAAGAVELEAAGGVDAFEDGFTFVSEAGGLEAVYNDFPDVKEFKVGNRIIPITSNVVLRPSTYTIGLTWEYRKLLDLCRSDIDKALSLVYYNYSS